MEEVELLKRELRNIRREMAELQRVYKRDCFVLEEKMRKWQQFDSQALGNVNKDSQILSEVQMDNWQCSLQPIGHISSVFRRKNGTPRQPMVCTNSPASLTINKNVFDNPGHSLEGLHEFSYVWVIFVFHKNSNAVRKAKVRPPRAQGKRLGLFATRSPHRPNPIGLSLAKIDKIEGATIFFSGVDMIDGTPVLDIKPYIPDYDQPQSLAADVVQDCEQDDAGDIEDNKMTPDQDGSDNLPRNNHTLITFSADVNTTDDNAVSLVVQTPTSADTILSDGVGELLANISNVEIGTSNNSVDADKSKGVLTSDKMQSKGEAVAVNGREGNHGHCTCVYESLNKDTRRTEVTNATEASQFLTTDGNGETINVASWLAVQPRDALTVRFTPEAERQLLLFHTQPEGNGHYLLSHLTSLDEVRSVIIQVLIGDPRSRYRKTKCIDKLFYFTVDSLHVTCWFDDCEPLVEVVRLRPACFAPKPRW